MQFALKEGRVVLFDHHCGFILPLGNLVQDRLALLSGKNEDTKFRVVFI